MPPEDKDAALFPRRIDGRWAMIHRPTPLRGTRQHVALLLARPPPLGRSHAPARGARRGLVGCREDRPGSAAGRDRPRLADDVPRRPPDGDGPIYRVGFVLFDLDDPTLVLHRCDEWAFGPHERYEREGDVDKVVFPCGWVVDRERDEILLYYGAADMNIGLATARLSERDRPRPDQHRSPNRPLDRPAAPPLTSAGVAQARSGGGASGGTREAMESTRPENPGQRPSRGTGASAT